MSDLMRGENSEYERRSIQWMPGCKGLSWALVCWLAAGLGDDVAQSTTLPPRSALPGQPLPHFCTSYPGSESRSKGTSNLGTAMVTTGDVSLVYIRVRFPDEPPEPVLFEEVSNDLTQATAALESISYGRCHLHWTITPVLTLPRSRDDYAAGDGLQRLAE
ncbi:MAG: hypothetical protein JNN07_11195 [Verrucomicrobiales bacterium]|nr:hypothetical protein [Verrucomicrobiales bacterium]